MAERIHDWKTIPWNTYQYARRVYSYNTYVNGYIERGEPLPSRS